jgi:hypothetical protein
MPPPWAGMFSGKESPLFVVFDFFGLVGTGISEPFGILDTNSVNKILLYFLSVLQIALRSKT